MTLPDNFHFSQSNLQDYVECARRFELKHIDKLKWPAVEAEPIFEWEGHMRRGAAFHHLIHQHLLGIPESSLSATEMEDDLREWWQVYLQDKWIQSLPETRFPETTLSIPIDGFRLVAKYDLVAVIPNEKITIIDWKTNKRKPSRTRLAERLQTIIYRYVMVKAGAFMNGGTPIQPDQVEMVYWFSADPSNPEFFMYSDEQYAEDEGYLKSLISEIANRSVFDLTTDTDRCQFCTYRSLCNRGIRAGTEPDLLESELVDIEFDFEQIAEIEF